MAGALQDYPTAEDREAELTRLATRAGAELFTVGQSVLGRPIRAARLPSTGKTGRRVLCVANIHGVEFIAGRVALGLMGALTSEGGAFAELREQAEVLVVPCANPDGYARTVDAQGVGTLQELRTNAHGVDLNRNFPLPYGATPSFLPTAGSAHHGDATFRGTHPFSEPETSALNTLFAREQFHALLSLHSFMGTLIPPRVTNAEDYATYGTLCSAFAARQPAWGYKRLASRHLDVFTGELEDHAHHVYGTWSSCVESFPVFHSIRQHLHAPSLFWRFNPQAPEQYVKNDVPGLVSFFLTALHQGRPRATMQ